MADHRKARLASSWSNLPQEIISRIERRLDNGLDVFLFRSVCKNWSSTRKHGRKSLLSPSLPCKISNVNLPFTDRPNDALILLARAVFLVKPCNSSTGWLLTVEETNPGKLRIMYPLSNDRVKHLPTNFPKYLDLSKFRVSQVAKSYGFKYASDNADVVGVRKVVFCSGGNATAMVLYGKGTLVGVRLKNGNWGYVRYSLTCMIKDVISFKGMVYAVDRYLKVLVIDYKTMNVIDMIDVRKSFQSTRSMHLVESNMELHLAQWDLSSGCYACSIQFNIHRLDEIQANWDPIDCLRSKVIFVSAGWCFVADIPIFNGDYILYSGDCMASCAVANRVKEKNHLFADASMDLDISVFFRNKDRYCTNSCGWSDIDDWLWPPPVWFLPEKYTCLGDDDNDEELSICKLDISLPEDLLPPYLAVVPAKDSKINRQGRDVHTTDGNSHAQSVQSDRNHSTVMFKGVKIKSFLAPTLQKVWEKYGNILKECKIRDADIVASALESLATALFLLESSSGRSLTTIQADYLSSVFCDLEHLNFNVKWLVPFIDKALAVHKIKAGR